MLELDSTSLPSDLHLTGKFDVHGQLSKLGDEEHFVHFQVFVAAHPI